VLELYVRRLLLLEELLISHLLLLCPPGFAPPLDFCSGCLVIFISLGIADAGLDQRVLTLPVHPAGEEI